jgi:hypothetical protein
MGPGCAARHVASISSVQTARDLAIPPRAWKSPFGSRPGALAGGVRRPEDWAEGDQC